MILCTTMQFRAGHKCYDPTYWLQHDQPYEVTVRNPCEPYFVALRDTLPHFDQRFRGRLRDKVRSQLLSALPCRDLLVAVDQCTTAGRNNRKLNEILCVRYYANTSARLWERPACAGGGGWVLSLIHI